MKQIVRLYSKIYLVLFTKISKLKTILIQEVYIEIRHKLRGMYIRLQKNLRCHFVDKNTKEIKIKTST